jgi:hypothetical protein
LFEEPVQRKQAGGSDVGNTSDRGFDDGLLTERF